MLLIEDRRHYVYAHSKATSGEIFYIGIGKSRRAWVMAQRNARHTRTVAKYGCDVRVLVRNLTGKEANAFEMQLIAEAKVLNIDLVNMTAGGDGCKNPTSEARKAIGDGRRGKKHSEETKALMSRNRSNPSAATRAKLSAALKGKPAYNKGVPMSDEQRKKSSMLRKGRSPPNKGVPMTTAQKEKLRVANIGKVLSEETKRKISVAGQGRVFSAERNAKVSEAKKAYWATRRGQ